MNKTQLINYVSRRTKLARKDSWNAVNWTLEGIMKGTKSREGMKLSGFGNFKCSTAKPKRKYNSKTKRYTWSKQSKSINFSPLKKYKDYVV